MSPLMGGGTIIDDTANAVLASNRLSGPNGQMVKDGKGSTNPGTGQKRITRILHLLLESAANKQAVISRRF